MREAEGVPEDHVGVVDGVGGRGGNPVGEGGVGGRGGGWGGWGGGVAGGLGDVAAGGVELVVSVWLVEGGC